MISSKRIQIGLVVGAAALGGLLVGRGFGVPLGTLLLLGLIVMCPLMMFGMHGGGHQHGGDTTSQPTQPTDQTGQASTSPHVH